MKSVPVFKQDSQTENSHHMDLKDCICNENSEGHVLNDLFGVLFGNFFAVWIQQYLLFCFLPAGLLLFILEEEQRYSKARILTSQLYD